MNSRFSLFLLVVMYWCYGVGVLLAEPEAKTIVRRGWQQTQRCEYGDSKDWIILTRYFSDGTSQTSFLWHNCDDECWHQTPWTLDIVSGPPYADLPAQTTTGGDWIVTGVPLATGGTFGAGSDMTCRNFTKDGSSTIFLPSVITGESSLN